MLIREANYFLSCIADTFSSRHTEHVFSVEGSCLQPLFWKLCERPMFHSGWHFCQEYSSVEVKAFTSSCSCFTFIVACDLLFWIFRFCTVMLVRN